MDDKELKELKEINKTLNSIRTFIIAEAQLLKAILVDQKNQSRDTKEIKLLMEKF